MSNTEFSRITIKVREEKSFFYIDIELDDNSHADAQVEVENGYVRILPGVRQLQYTMPYQSRKAMFDRLIKLPDNVDNTLFKKTVFQNQISLIFPIKAIDSLSQMYY